MPNPSYTSAEVRNLLKIRDDYINDLQDYANDLLLKIHQMSSEPSLSKASVREWSLSAQMVAIKREINFLKSKRIKPKT